MKKKILIASLVLLCVGAVVGVSCYLMQVEKRYSVYLHRNIFIDYGYEGNIEQRLPFEVMLTDFMANDTTSEHATFRACTFVQPLDNEDPSQIEELIFEPYQVIVYKGHRLYINEFYYDRQSNKLTLEMVIEQRKYQRIFK